jgi:RHS repeat-associated protein
LELDETGKVISYEEYHPYGTTSYQARDSAAEVSLKRYRYTGKERDEESGFYYHGKRYYTCWLGRWVSSDPLIFSNQVLQALEHYIYTRNNPVIFIDPDGQQQRSAVIGPGNPNESPVPSRYLVISHDEIGGQYVVTVVKDTLTDKIIVDTRMKGRASTVEDPHLSPVRTPLGALAGGIARQSGASWEDASKIAEIFSAFEEALAAPAMYKELTSSRKGSTAEKTTENVSVEQKPIRISDPVVKARITEGVLKGESAGTASRMKYPLGIPEKEGGRLAQSIRNSLDLDSGGNIAIAESIINGKRELRTAFSKKDIPAGTVGNPEHIVFGTVPSGAQSREFDAEYRVLSDIAQGLPREAQGIVSLYTEKDPCTSCQGVIDQFERAFPGIELNITYGSMTKVNLVR